MKLIGISFTGGNVYEINQMLINSTFILTEFPKCHNLRHLKISSANSFSTTSGDLRVFFVVSFEALLRNSLFEAAIKE